MSKRGINNNQEKILAIDCVFCQFFHLVFASIYYTNICHFQQVLCKNVLFKISLHTWRIVFLSEECHLYFTDIFAVQSVSV